MPEYLAPGVYVEEIDTGSKPIEGVSTSTGGMVGVTERGPEDVPILITSFGEFTRWFGGYLDPQVFVNPQGPNCFLPHAVEGFFSNGGKRVFVVRILDNLAEFASTMLFDRSSVGANTSLLLPVAAGGTSVYLADTPGVAAGGWLEIGGGSEAEYRQVSALGAANHVPLNLPLNLAYPPGVAAATVERYAPAGVAVAGPVLNIPAATNAGAKQFVLSALTGLAISSLIRIGDPADGDDEYIFIETIDVVTKTVHLRTPLMLSHPAAVHVQLITALVPAVAGDATKLASASAVGDVLLFLQNSAAFATPGDFVRITDPAVANAVEIRRIGQTRSATLSAGGYADYPAHSIIEAVMLSDDVGEPGGRAMAEAQAGTNVIVLNKRQGLKERDVVRIATAGTADVEYLTILAIQNRLTGPDAGNVVLAGALQRGHPAGTDVALQAAPVSRVAAIQPVALVLGTARNGLKLLLSNGNNYIANTTVAVHTVAGVFYHRVESVAAAGLASGPVTLSAPLSRPHLAGDRIMARTPLLRVQALDRGAWGNRLRVTVQDQDPPLLRTQIREIVGTLHIRLNSASGIEVGTVLQRTAANGTFVGAPFKVINLDRQNDNLLTLDAALPVTAAVGDAVRSIEFQINVLLLRQPDPAVPTRSGMLLDSESFRYLSMDHRHSRYVEKVIGTTWTLRSTTDHALPPQPLRLEDRRSQGESRYLRITDLGKLVTGAGEPENTLRNVRPGPELLVDDLPDGRRRPARRALTDGLDAEGAMVDETYIGLDNPEPRLRTGIQCLRNEEEISIVACPGRTSQTLQNRLIEHCEELRYRFAILDAQQPPRDSLNDVQNQRQQYDTKYAALYHPWPLIPDPFPTNPAIVKDYSIPPGGHVMGIYARTDIERGVHKAPANEVMRGVIGLQRLLNKGEQDILNPYPVNINVIRDFRPNNRGIRVWGGRVITSDPDWKYVNVRRLLIFIEASLDRGLQWVVFEPNAEPLWARVHRTVSNFLTSVWRDGALEGTKPEEAYFVKVDRTTMTQTDIDNGKLIVLIGVAPVKPAEFVIIRIGLWTAHADS